MTLNMSKKEAQDKMWAFILKVIAEEKRKTEPSLSKASG